MEDFARQHPGVIVTQPRGDGGLPDKWVWFALSAHAADGRQWRGHPHIVAGSAQGA